MHKKNNALRRRKRGNAATLSDAPASLETYPTACGPMKKINQLNNSLLACYIETKEMVESKVMASVGCGKFVSRRGNWSRSSKYCRCLTPGEAHRRERMANLNPNRRYRPVTQPEPLRLTGCSCGEPSLRMRRASRQRAVRTAQRAPLPIAWVSLPTACEFADVLYYAWRHRFFAGSGDVQAQLARGYRYTVPRRGVEKCGGSPSGAGGGFSNSVTLEAPQGQICYRTQADVKDIVATLPGACRAASRVEQAQVQCAIANWWLGEARAQQVLDSLDPVQVDDVPLDPACAECNNFAEQLTTLSNNDSISH